MGNFGQFVQDKESDDAGQLLSASLGKLRKDRSELGFNQGLASQHVLRTTINLVIRLTGSSIKGNHIKICK